MKSLKRMVPLLGATLVLLLLFWWRVPGFLNTENLLDLAQQISVNAIMAFGMTLAILIGGIDLSVGALLALVGTTTVFVLTVQGGESQSVAWLSLSIAAGLGVSLVFGLFHGLSAATTRMPPFIITLATMLVARGCALRYNEGRPMHIPEFQTIFLEIGNGRLWGKVPIPVLIMLVIFTAMVVLLHQTRLGQYIYAMGGNREAARFTGIPLVRVEVIVYTICSVLTGVAGMIHTSQLYSAEPGSGVGFELNAIAAAVVGGTSFTGGRGTMVGTLLGAVIIGILSKGLNQAGVHFSLQYIVNGLVILGAVFIDVRGKSTR